MDGWRLPPLHPLPFSPLPSREQKRKVELFNSTQITEKRPSYVVVVLVVVKVEMSALSCLLLHATYMYV